MKDNYHETVQEIKELTSVDGFVAACLDIKESMFFYERDLVLAAYASSLELLAVVAMFTASLDGDISAKAAYDEINESVNGLFIALQETNLPIDIQYLGEHFMRGTGYATRLRLPVYGAMIKYYENGLYKKTDNTDDLLRECQRQLYKARQTNRNPDDTINKLLGLVGAQILCGAHLRAIWMHIVPPRIRLILSGLQTIANNFSVAPYFTFPFADIETERQKRTKVGNNVVIDLAVFRNFRQSVGGYTDLRVALEQDEYDQFLDEYFSKSTQTKPQDMLAERDQVLTKIFLGVLESRLINDSLDDLYIARAAQALYHWQVPEAAPIANLLFDELKQEDVVLPDIKKLVKEN